MKNIPWKKIVLLLFSLSVILPQGVGIQLPNNLPSIDLPRLIDILLIFTFLSYVYVKGHSFKRIINNHYPTNKKLLLIIVILYCSAFLSESPSASLLWATGDTILFFGFAFIVIYILSEEKITQDEFIKTIVIIGFILMTWTTIELIIQENLILYRPIWKNDLFLHLKRFWLMPVGPFAIVKALAEALILFGTPFLILQKNKKNIVYFPLSFILIVCLIGTQTISAVISLTIILLTIAYYYRNLFSLWVLSLLFLSIISLQTFIPDSHQYFSTYVTDGRASFDARLINNSFLYSNLLAQNNWLFGFGPGSLMDPARMISSVYLGGEASRTDPGSLIIWFIELGVIAGSLIIYMLLSAIIKGLRTSNETIRSLAISLIGFLIFSLSAPTPYLWGIALVYTGMIEFWIGQESAADKRIKHESTASLTRY